MGEADKERPWALCDPVQDRSSEWRQRTGRAINSRGEVRNTSQSGAERKTHSLGREERGGRESPKGRRQAGKQRSPDREEPREQGAEAPGGRAQKVGEFSHSWEQKGQVCCWGSCREGHGRKTAGPLLLNEKFRIYQ